MNKVLKVFGIIALVAVMGFTMVGCKEEDSSGSEGGEVTISGEAKLNGTLTAKGGYGDYEWEKSDTGTGGYGWSLVLFTTSGARNEKLLLEDVYSAFPPYELVSGVKGKYIRAKAKSSDFIYANTIYSNILGPVTE